MQEMVTGITEAVISTVHSVGRILYLRPFNEHVGTSVTAGPNVQDIVRGSRAFCTTSADISAKVEADFAEAEVRFAIPQTYPEKNISGFPSLHACCLYAMEASGELHPSIDHGAGPAEHPPVRGEEPERDIRATWSRIAVYNSTDRLMRTSLHSFGARIRLA